MMPMLSPPPRRKLSEDEFYALGGGRFPRLLRGLRRLASLCAPRRGRLTARLSCPMLTGSSQSKERRRCA